MKHAPLAARSFGFIAVIALLAACGQPDAPEADIASGGSEASLARTAETASAGDKGSGTLQLGDVTYSFSVGACDVSGEFDGDYQTIVGTGRTPDGHPFMVFVERSGNANMTSHTISFQSGSVGTGGATVIEANRLRMNGSWMSLTGDPSEPLINVNGNRVSASGTFVDEDTEASQPGRLEATCTA